MANWKDRLDIKDVWSRYDTGDDDEISLSRARLEDHGPAGSSGLGGASFSTLTT